MLLRNGGPWVCVHDPLGGIFPGCSPAIQLDRKAQVIKMGILDKSGLNMAAIFQIPYLQPFPDSLQQIWNDRVVPEICKPDPGAVHIHRAGQEQARTCRKGGEKKKLVFSYNKALQRSAEHMLIVETRL